MNSIFTFVILIILIILVGFFTSSETAYLSLPKLKVRSMVEERKAYAKKAVKPLIESASKTFLGRYTLQDPWLSLEILRKNLYEVNYEVNNRPHMAYIAIDGLTDLLKPISKERTVFQTRGSENTL